MIARRPRAAPRLPRAQNLDGFCLRGFIVKWAQKIRAGGFSERWSELIAQHARGHLVDRALRDLAKLKRSKGKPDQTVDLKPDMLEHALDLTVFSFAQRHRKPAIGALHTIEGGFDAGIIHALECNPLPKLI